MLGPLGEFLRLHAAERPEPDELEPVPGDEPLAPLAGAGGAAAQVAVA